MNKLELAAGLSATPGYEYARRVGDQLLIAGQVPHDAIGRLVGAGDANAQCLQCLTNLQKLLQVHGFASADVQRLVVYVVGADADLAAAWNAVLAHFEGRVPPATLLGVARLGHIGQLVEVDATIMKASPISRVGDATFSLHDSASEGIQCT